MLHTHTQVHTHTYIHTHTQAHTHTYIHTHMHTGANGGDVQRGDQKDLYIVLKTLKLLPREWAKDLNTCFSIEKRSYQVKDWAGGLCTVRVHVYVCVVCCVIVCV